MNVFNKYTKEYDSWYDKNKYAYLSEIEAIRKVLPKKGIGLEIGVGTGRFAAPLGIKYGIDPSEKMLEIARAVAPIATESFEEYTLHAVTLSRTELSAMKSLIAGDKEKHDELSGKLDKLERDEFEKKLSD